MPAPVTTVIGDEKLTKENADLRLEKKMLQQELALSRAQGEALRTAIENRAADGDTSRRLVEKLNETSKELAALRVSYARLQSERGPAAVASSEAALLKSQLGQTEEKLAASLRNYTQLQEEIARLKSDVAQTRTENLALTAQVKTITAQNEQAQAALAQLNRDLLTQKDARVRAEQDAATLRTELKSVAPNSSILAQLRTGAAADARSLAAEHAAETATLKDQLNALQAKVEALNAERAQLRQKLLVRSSADLANVEARLASALKSESALKLENAELKASRTELAQQLSRAKAAPTGVAEQDVPEQLRQAQAEVAALTDENAKLKARLSQPEAESIRVRPLAAARGIPTVVPTAVPASSPANGIIVRPSGVSATLVAAVPNASRSTVTTSENAAAGRLHTVAGGDTLAKISTQYYGTPGRWGDILAANRDVLGESNNLVIGRTLRIP